MSHRNLADILEEITDCELVTKTRGDSTGRRARRLTELHKEVSEHPDAAAGKDLPPIEGKIG